MRRYTILFALALSLVLATSAMAVFPQRDGAVTLPLQQGFVDGEVAWYVCTATNDIRTACGCRTLVLSPELTSALRGGAPAMYVFLNSNQGPVFSAKPGDANYSGLWQVFYVTWDVQGQYANDEDDILRGPTSIQKTKIIMDCPIVAVGPLGGRWYPAPYGTYRIPQALGYNSYQKTITLPTFEVFCDNPTTGRPFITCVAITDVADRTLARVLGANYAPGLNRVPYKDTQNFYVQRGPKPCKQLPVIEECPTRCDCFNTNRFYTPIMNYVLLHRTGVPPYTLINNEEFLELLIKKGQLTVASDNQRINAPVVCCPQQGICPR